MIKKDKYNLLIEEMKVSFNKNAVGGFRHASFETASASIAHIIPGSEVLVDTTAIDNIRIKFTELDNEYVIVATYTAISIL